ncbi:unnamed protein product [Vitrella brassicaformis CCMP3155]|uniref:Uncharacterized protein n=1 Tax=Vitrella brassicaformis (strain CCMP3155) TaxID=1169540 RepID=A0A0G4FPQ5_VITBC|nr:unnamed protein product [Vitrella brassicaformis CCMP3155]|eukprot:CEM16443.1 unnamed protein product [Vitrella brassicaformis CCMP3155]
MRPLYLLPLCSCLLSSDICADGALNLLPAESTEEALADVRHLILSGRIALELQDPANATDSDSNSNTTAHDGGSAGATSFEPTEDAAEADDGEEGNADADGDAEEELWERHVKTMFFHRFLPHFNLTSADDAKRVLQWPGGSTSCSRQPPPKDQPPAPAQCSPTARRLCLPGTSSPRTASWMAKNFKLRRLTQVASGPLEGEGVMRAMGKSKRKSKSKNMGVINTKNVLVSLHAMDDSLCSSLHHGPYCAGLTQGFPIHTDGIRLFTAPSLASTVFLHAAKTPTAEQPDTKDEEEAAQPAEGSEVTGQQKKALMKMLRSMIGKAGKRPPSQRKRRQAAAM